MFLSPKQTKQDTRKLWELVNVSIIFIVVMVLQVFAYVQTYQIAHIKYMFSFLYINYTSIKLILKRGKKKEVLITCCWMGKT